MIKAVLRMVRLLAFSSYLLLCYSALDVCSARSALAGDISSSFSSPWIHTGVDDGHFYETETGRVRIFHGCNRVKKGFPWYFENFGPEASNATYDFMQSLGITVVRMGFMWSGFNPSPGYFNQTYLGIVQNAVRRLADRGIHTLLDLHQDVMSTKFCLYDGVPLWVVNKSVPEHPFPWPLKGNCSSRGWMINSLSEAAATAYQDLYDNKNGMLDDLAMFWKTAAAAFQNEPGVIGYEIMNEPFAGNFYANPLTLLPGNGGKNLEKMYDHVAPRIRDVDDRHIIFFEPVTWGMIFNGKVMGTGFTHVPGGLDYRNRSALSFHYYCATFDPNYSKEPITRRFTCDHLIGPDVFKAIKEDLADIGGASMMTEGMSCPAMNDNATNEEECWNVVGMLDEHLFSWTDYSNSQGEGFESTLTDAQLRLWSRTYARAIAGKPINMTFHRDTSAFDLCYAISGDMFEQETEIFVSLDHHYSNGLAVVTTSNLEASPTAVGANETGFRTIRVKQAAGQSSGVGCVHITAA